MFGVAVLGYGVVGSGVVEVIDKNFDRVAQSAAREIRVKYIVDLRDFPDSIYKELFVKDFAIIEADPEVRVVVETIGGVGAAYEFTRRSLLAGKSVVTSNKELVATRGWELLQIAKEKDVNYLFEASVGGGIPILRPITQCLAANRINEIYGILNGTTNYILTSMIKHGASFEDALKQAQANGYAEQNPTSDIEGIDACRKICILADLCFGRNMDPDWVKTVGISAVTPVDIHYADGAGYKIKLLGRAVSLQDGTKATAYVAPHLVREDNLLASVDGVMNGIVVRGNAIGDVMFYGAGAGKLPTASAVVADIIDAAKHDGARKYIGWDEGSRDTFFDSALLESRWYIRAQVTAAVARSAFGDVQILGGTDGETAFITSSMGKNTLDSTLESVTALTVFRVLG
ncbi:MAG: homoserine dehydrogenase [Oscillospiraceae bacterium]|jgi:homoserine dehydrogenase|nr:homoserine dehydrogenase [Oscillospiraceae bacterium]